MFSHLCILSTSAAAVFQGPTWRELGAMGYLASAVPAFLEDGSPNRWQPGKTLFDARLIERAKGRAATRK